MTEMGEIFVEYHDLDFFTPAPEHNLMEKQVCKINCDKESGYLTIYITNAENQACFTCFTEAFPKQYFDQKSNTCKTCDISCFTCNGEGPENCLTCPPEDNLPMGATEFS